MRMRGGYQCRKNKFYHQKCLESDFRHFINSNTNMKSLLPLLYTTLVFFQVAEAQSFYGKAQYDIKLFEDSFFFDATLEFTESESRFVFKQHEKQDWFRQDQSQFKSQKIRTDSIGYIIYRKFNKNKMSVRSFCELGKPMVYEDSVNIKWSLGSDTKVIQGVACLNASASFRGRKYEAWYSPDIPVNVGPWKFSGLPGLIIQVKDKKENISITIKSLDISKSDKKIDNQLNGLGISRENFYKCLDEEWVKLYINNKAIIAQLQAEFPDLELSDNDASKVRIGTELNFKE